MAKYRKKPIVVEAQQWYPPMRSLSWCRQIWCWLCLHRWDAAGPFVYFCRDCGLTEIWTLEGHFTVAPGDWIITGVFGERYSCKNEIFVRTYEVVQP